MDLLKEALSEFLLQDKVEGRLLIQPEQGNIRAALYEIGAVTQEETGLDGQCILNILLSKQDFAIIQKKFAIELTFESSELLDNPDDHTMSASNV
jgi:GTP-binding protein HflX